MSPSMPWSTVIPRRVSIFHNKFWISSFVEGWALTLTFFGVGFTEPSCLYGGLIIFFLFVEGTLSLASFNGGGLPLPFCQRRGVGHLPSSDGSNHSFFLREGRPSSFLWRDRVAKLKHLYEAETPPPSCITTTKLKHLHQAQTPPLSWNTSTPSWARQETPSRVSWNLKEISPAQVEDGWDLQNWSLPGKYGELSVNTSQIRSDWEPARRDLDTVTSINPILSESGDPQQGFLKSPGNQTCSGGRWMISP